MSAIEKAAKRLKNLKLWSVALVDRPANPEAKIVIAKADGSYQCPQCGATMTGIQCSACNYMKGSTQRDGTQAQNGLAPPMTKGTPGMADVHVNTDLNKGQPMTDAEKAAIEKAQADTKAQLEAIQKRNEALEAANKTQAELLAKMAASAKRREYVAKAAEFTGLPGVSEDFAAILEKIDEGLTSEESAKVYEVLRASKAAIAKGKLFAELGRVGDGPAPKDKTMQALTKDAGVTKGGKITAETPADAIEKALRQNEDSYNAEWADAPSMTVEKAHGTGYNVGRE